MKPRTHYSCDTCDRPVGIGPDCIESEEMRKATLHFCNNNCKEVHGVIKTHVFYWVSANWPKRASA